ncbi:MAG: hypothetical protein OXR72_07570 [Gemmatimonadota bacterium]|nr:hypothetical protein [Gemmatimonadota bacterium]
MTNERYTGPNLEVLEAQSRVCTGPHQSRPLGVKPADPRPGRILELILRSVREELPETMRASPVQMGAFFVAMTLRRGFPSRTRWSCAETEAFEGNREALRQCLPKEMLFLLDPSSKLRPQDDQEAVLISALGKVLAGDHLSYGETRRMCGVILGGHGRAALYGAALIGQRMNRETYDEARGYLDAAFDPSGVVALNVGSLTHFGEPYDGSKRYFRPTLFVAAARAALGRPTVLHGVDGMPPKWGVTDEQILKALGANVDLSLDQAGGLIENPEVGFAYVSQRIFSPAAYASRELRTHIGKRPPWAATEKAQQLFACPGENHMVVGYYHPGYEDMFLQLAVDRGFNSCLVVKGMEGGSSLGLRLGKPSDGERKAINNVRGFRTVDGRIETYDRDVDPVDAGFGYELQPRPESVSADAFARAGFAALSGKKGWIYDQIVLNAAAKDNLLGFDADPSTAIERARYAIESGSALTHLKAYVDASNGIAGRASRSLHGAVRPQPHVISRDHPV